jgi:MFS family permease
MHDIDRKETSVHRHPTNPRTRARGDAPCPRGRLLAALLVAQLMVILDITAVNIAMPDIARDLDIGGASISWAITAYSLVFGSLLLLGGRAADAIGRRRVFLAGSAGVLFAARAGQGLGAALLSPAALAIITSSFHGAERAKALAAWGAVGGAGAAAGVLIGGVMTELVDWRLIFLVNLPVGLALAGAIRAIVPADGRIARRRRLDARSAVLATAGLAAIVYAITQAGEAGWTARQTILTGGLGVAALAAFALGERRSAAPLLPMAQLRDRAVGAGLALLLVNAGLMFGLFLLCSLYLQVSLGHGPLPTGMAFLPLALAAAGGAHVGGVAINRYGVRRAVGPAFALAAAGLWLLSRLPADGAYLRDVLPGMLIAGFGLGVSGVAVSIAVMAGARSEEAGSVSGASATCHEVGGTFGIAVLTSIAVAAGGGIVGGPAAAEGIAQAFKVAGGVALVAAVAALVVLPAARTFLPRLRVAPHVAGAH